MIYKCFATRKLLGGIKVGWVIKQTVYTFKKSLMRGLKKKVIASGRPYLMVLNEAKKV